MRHRALKRWLILVALATISVYAWAYSTQEQFDRATACCWGISGYNTYCDIPNACGNGSTCCRSDYFVGLIDSLGYLSCNVFSNATSSGGTSTPVGNAQGLFTGAEPEASAALLLTTDGMLNVDALSAQSGNACVASSGTVTALASTAPVATGESQVPTEALNAPDVSVERLFLAENENASPPVIGFLPYQDRNAVEDDHLYALGYSKVKGFELVDVRDVGGPVVRDLNPRGDSYAGYPQYDARTIKAFDGKLFFYAMQPNGEYEMSSLRAGSALNDVNADPAGGDIPRDYADANGGLKYESGYIHQFQILRGMLMSAASRRVPVQPPAGLDLGDVRLYDFEPERIHRGRVPTAEIVDMYPEGYSLPRNMVEFNGAVYMIAKVSGGYSACGEGRDYQLVRLNDDGTSEVIQVNPDGWGFYPDIDYPPMQVFGGDLYFVANQGPPGNDRHELMRLTSNDQVSRVPINPDGGAFPNIDEAQYWDGLTPALVPFGGSLYVLGANVSGSCTAGCGTPYVEKIVKINSAGAVSVITPTNSTGSFESTDPEFIQTRFVSTVFSNRLYFWCGGCTDSDLGLYRLNSDDSVNYFNDRWVVPFQRGPDQSVLGVQRGDHLYMYSDYFQFDPVFEHVARLIRADADGSITPLTSPDFGYEYVYNMVLLGNTIVAGANIFSDPVPDYATNWLGSELLLIQPDDSLGYVDVAPGFDEQGNPHTSFPYGLTVVGNSVVFASYTDPTYESPYFDMFRLHIGGKGNGPKSAAAEASSSKALVWPVARPPRTMSGQAADSRAARSLAALQDALRKRLEINSEGMSGLPQADARDGLNLQDYQLLEYASRGPGAEAFKAQLRRQAAARAKAKVTQEACSSGSD